MIQYLSAVTRFSLVGIGAWLCLVGLVHAQPPQQSQTQPEPQSIVAVEFLYSSTAAIPDADADWRTMTLPFNTREDVNTRFDNNLQSRYIWFRFNLDRPAYDLRYSLYFWRFNLSLTVFFNGMEVGGSPVRSVRETVSWNRPLLVEIQPGNWAANDNQVTLRLHRSVWGGNLAPVLFGESNQIHELWSARMLRQVEINQTLLAFGLSLSLITCILWLVRRQDTVYLWLSGIGLSWSVVTTHMVIQFSPILYEYWLPLVHGAIDICIFCMYGFIGRVANVKKRFRENLLLAWTLFAVAGHFLVSHENFFLLAYSFHLVGTFALLAIVVRVTFEALRKRQLEAIIITVAMLTQIGLFVHNMFLMFFAPVERWEGAMFYAHFGVPLLLVVFAFTLLIRFINALSMAETLNRELESKVEKSRRVIENSFAERRVLELNQAAEQERLKIYRDLHDDVGSKLLSIVHAGRENKLGDMARSALESLRQSVSRANNPDQLLSAFLQDIREETELRLQGSGHVVEWQQPGSITESVVPSVRAFNLNRIFKELVSNIIRHAGADKVSVLLHNEGNQWTFSIRDNGRGFDLDGAHGNGVNNINSRANEIDAGIDWQSDSSGTLVTLRLAIDGASTQTIELMNTV